MGGNLVLKAAGELGGSNPALKGVVAVCPNIDPAACTAALIQPRNWIYNLHFVRSLKARLRRKARLFPDRFDPAPLAGIRTLLDFDEAYTAPDGGYRDAADYYEQAGSRHVLGSIAVPTLILTAQDDPFIPYWIFDMIWIINIICCLIIFVKYRSSPFRDLNYNFDLIWGVQPITFRRYNIP